MHEQRAFTLFELLSVITISALLLLVALPNMRIFIEKHRLESSVELLLLAIKSAKVSAIKHDGRIIICARARQLIGCSEKSDKGVKDWSHGWLVFDDLNSDKQYQVNELLINEVGLTKNSCVLTWNRGSYLSFAQFGVLQGGRAGSFKLTCDNQSTQLIINWVGRVRRQN